MISKCVHCVLFVLHFDSIFCFSIKGWFYASPVIYCVVMCHWPDKFDQKTRGLNHVPTYTWLCVFLAYFKKFKCSEEFDQKQNKSMVAWRKHGLFGAGWREGGGLGQSGCRGLTVLFLVLFFWKLKWRPACLRTFWGPSTNHNKCMV